MTARLTLLGLVAVSALLAGCGRQGDLERPAPLFGSQEAYKEYKAKKEAGENTDPGAVVPNRAPDNAGDDTNVVIPPAGDSTTTPLPQRTAPIPGAQPDPFGTRNSGALPDPYANPNRSQ